MAPEKAQSIRMSTRKTKSLPPCWFMDQATPVRKRSANVVAASVAKPQEIILQKPTSSEPAPLEKIPKEPATVVAAELPLAVQGPSATPVSKATKPATVVTTQVLSSRHSTTSEQQRPIPLQTATPPGQIETIPSQSATLVAPELPKTVETSEINDKAMKKKKKLSIFGKMKKLKQRLRQKEQDGRGQASSDEREGRREQKDTRREQGETGREQGETGREQGETRRKQGQDRREQGHYRREQRQDRREQRQGRRGQSRHYQGHGGHYQGQRRQWYGTPSQPIPTTMLTVPPPLTLLTQQYLPYGYQPYGSFLTYSNPTPPPPPGGYYPYGRY